MLNDSELIFAADSLIEVSEKLVITVNQDILGFNETSKQFITMQHESVMMLANALKNLVKSHKITLEDMAILKHLNAKQILDLSTATNN